MRFLAIKKKKKKKKIQFDIYVIRKYSFIYQTNISYNNCHPII